MLVIEVLTMYKDTLLQILPNADTREANQRRLPEAPCWQHALLVQTEATVTVPCDIK